MKGFGKIFLVTLLLTSCGHNRSEVFMEKYLTDSTVQRILVVTQNDKTSADAKYYEKSDSCWKLIFTTPAYIGKNGTGKEKEGDGKTPLGDFAVTGAFGILPNPGTSMAYREITTSTFACDEDCIYYNTIIDTAVVHHMCHGEAMYEITPQYNYGLTIDYNPENVYPAGSAIFVHCMGDKRYTGGCIAVCQTVMKAILEDAQEGMRVYIE